MIFRHYLIRCLYIALCLLPAGAINAQTAMGNWTNTGPVPFPTNVSGQVHGIGRVSQIKFHPTNSSKVYAVSASGGLFISSNNGITWAPTPGTEVLPATSSSAMCINYANDQTLYLCLGDANYYSNNYGVYKSYNGGASWAPANGGIGTNMAVEILMDPTDTSKLVAATKGGIYRTTNGGSTWTLVQAGVFRDMKAKPVAGSSTLYAVTATQFFYSTNFGLTWLPVTTGVTPPSGNGGMRIAVSANDTARVYLATTGGNGVIFKSTNSGLSFTQVYSSTSQCITCYDATVTSGSQGDYNFDVTANPQNANELLLIAHCVWRSTNAGATWSKRTTWYTECHTDMHHIEWNPYNNTQRWNANDGGVWMSTDTNATIWSPRSDGLAATEIYHAAQSPVVRDLISIGTQDNGELYYSLGAWKTNRGGDWTARCYIDYRSNGNVWYMSNGKRRTLLPLGSDQLYNNPFIATNNARMEFVPGLPNTAFMGKDSIFRSTNINATTPTWQLLRASTEAVREITSCRADSNILYLATGSNHLFRSDNALASVPTFTQLTTPASTAVTASVTTVRSNANIVFMSCGPTVYRSIDKGVTWSNISGTGLSGLNIRRIIHDDYSTTQRLFVNAGPYVHYKDSTSTAWTNHTTAAGLPTVCNGSDFMIYNDGTVSSILRVSTYGRGVWECNIANNLAPIANFSASPTLVCPGDSVHFAHNVNGVFTSLSWTFAGGSPSTSTSLAPAVLYTSPGVYTVTLTATNSIGSNTITKTGYIVVSNGQTAQVIEGFEGTTYPPAGWQLRNGSGSDWLQDPSAGAYGTSSKSISFDNYNIDGGGAHDRILAPKVNLAGVSNARVKFDVAYAPYSTNSYLDTLQVKVSTDCGQTWTTIYNRSAATIPSLATAPLNTAASFVPTASQWRTDSVSLLPYVGNGLMLSFENVGHYGQALYLDNINLLMSPLAAFAANDTTVCEGTSVAFSDSSANATSWAWSFPGGTPAVSTAQSPSATYPTAGTYSVSLTAGNSLGSGVSTRTSYITVTPNPVPIVTASGSVLSASGSGTYQWYLNGSPIAGATSATYTAIDGGAYTVQVTNTSGCSGTSSAYIYTKLGLSNALKDAGYDIYPNPATGVFTITGVNIRAASVVLTCYNALGGKVRQEALKVSNGHIHSVVDWTSLARGVYAISLQEDGNKKPIRSTLILR